MFGKMPQYFKPFSHPSVRSSREITSLRQTNLKLQTTVLWLCVKSTHFLCETQQVLGTQGKQRHLSSNMRETQRRVPTVWEERRGSIYPVEGDGEKTHQRKPSGRLGNKPGLTTRGAQGGDGAGWRAEAWERDWRDQRGLQLQWRPHKQEEGVTACTR